MLPQFSGQAWHVERGGGAFLLWKIERLDVEKGAFLLWKIGLVDVEKEPFVVENRAFGRGKGSLLLWKAGLVDMETAMPENRLK